MSQDHQVQIAASAVVAAARGMGSLTAFDHRYDRLHLAAVAIPGAVEANLHQPTITPAGGLVGAPANCRRDDRADAVFVARVAMVPLGIESRVGADPLGTDAA